MKMLVCPDQTEMSEISNKLPKLEPRVEAGGS